MESLTANLQQKISSRPTQTILRSEDEKTNTEFIKVTHINAAYGIKLPDSFDGRIVWKHLLTPVMNQGKCGSCWAFASTSMLADRFNIQSVGLVNIQLSPAKLILCDWQGKELQVDHPEDSYSTSTINSKALQTSACFGNSLVDACRYLYQIGTPTEQCVPYTKTLGTQDQFQKIGAFENVAELPLCSSVAGPLGDMCSDFNIDKYTGEENGTPERFYRALHFYSLSGTEYNLRENIYKWGPIATGMKIYTDFYTFNPKIDIYEWNKQGPQVGGHAVEIVGWGNTDSKLYWIVKNSWGEEWGMNGYFRIIRGVNMCEIEENCMGMVPDFFYPEDYVIPDQKILSEEKNIQAERTKIATNINTTAGGIDPTTGYSRRVMIEMPWLNFRPGINWKDLPDWNHFIAGRDATIANRTKYQSIINQKYNDIKYGKQAIYIYLVVGSIIIISIYTVLFLLWKNNKK